MTQTSVAVVQGTYVILRSRWQVARNMFWRGSLWRKAGTALTLIIALVVSYALFRLSGLLVSGIRRLEREQPALLAILGDLPGLLQAVPSVVFAGASVPLLLSSLSLALATLYLARDLDLLLVTPTPMRAVFLARFFEGLLPIYVLLFVVLFPALVGYGLAWGYGIAYVLVLPVLLVLLPLLPMSIGVALTMILVRIVSPARLRELMAVLGGVLGVGVYVSTQLLGRAGGRDATVDAAEQLLRLDIGLLPTTWAARVLIGAGTGDTRAVAVYGLAYLVATLGLFSLMLVFVERLYYAGWINIAGELGGRARRRDRPDTRRTWLRGPAGAILRKDLLTLPRDLQRLSQLLLPLGLSLFWAWQLVAGGRRGGTDNLLWSLISITLLVCILIGSNLGLTGLSREGAGYWLLHLAPISPWPILLAKAVVAFLPFPIIGTLFTVLIGLLRQPPAGDLLQAWALVLLTGAGVSAISTSAGGAFPRFDWTQAQRMTTLRAGCLAPVVYYGYTGLMLVLTLGASRLAVRWGTPALVGGWVGAVLLTIAAVLVPLWFAAARMRQLEI